MCKTPGPPSTSASTSASSALVFTARWARTSPRCAPCRRTTGTTIGRTTWRSGATRAPPAFGSTPRPCTGREARLPPPRWTLHLGAFRTTFAQRCEEHCEGNRAPVWSLGGHCSPLLSLSPVAFCPRHSTNFAFSPLPASRANGSPTSLSPTDGRGIGTRYHAPSSKRAKSKGVFAPHISAHVLRPHAACCTLPTRLAYSSCLLVLPSLLLPLFLLTRRVR